MCKIRIKNFGPIKNGFSENNGWMEVKKFTAFIGDQASGKSSIAKVISTFIWLEKSLNRGDNDKNEFSAHSIREYFKFQGIYDYFHFNTEIDFQGDKYSILYRSKEVPVIKSFEKSDYIVPKIMYIPAERNILSTIKNVYNVTGMPEHLFTFAEELKKAQKELKGHRLELPINNFKYEYDEITDSSYVVGLDHRIDILKASSGLQSFIPLYLVSRNLAQLVTQHDELLRKNMNADLSIRMNEEITSLMLKQAVSEEERNFSLIEIRIKYLGKGFINIVEEPEQNLFPKSQRVILNSLLEFANMSSGNKLIITTHSPYIINYLTLAVKAHLLKDRTKTDVLKKKLGDIVPLHSTVNPDDLAIYELDERNGTIKKLGNYKGLPSDDNYLNEGLEESNDLFSKLLDIEDLCQ